MWRCLRGDEGVKALTDQEAIAWCEERSLRVNGDRTLLSLRDQAEVGCVELSVPKESPRALAMAYVVLMTSLKDDKETNFDGALVWLTAWDIWSETSERVGWRLMELLRGASGEHRSLADAPALLFDRDELVEAHACLTLTMFFQWDAYVVPASGDHFVRVSHEGLLHVVAGTRLGRKRLLARFRKWAPCDRCPEYLKGSGALSANRKQPVKR